MELVMAWILSVSVLGNFGVFYKLDEIGNDANIGIRDFTM